MLQRVFAMIGLLGLVFFITACPQQQTSRKMDFNDAETRLRLAMNVNELAYTSWNRVYENFGQLKKEGRLSDARWAAVQAIDSVIVMSEADLLDGIDRSKKLLEIWRKSSMQLLTAENPQDVVALREYELDALQQFKASVAKLTEKSIRLRDSYAEALMVTDKATKEGLPLPSEHLSAIRQVIKMVDYQVGKGSPMRGTTPRATAAETALPTGGNER